MERIQQIDMYKALRTKSGTWEAPPKKESHDDGHNDGGETCLKQPIYRQRQGADRLIMYFEVAQSTHRDSIIEKASLP